jgi:radical SAM-linked protein
MVGDKVRIRFRKGGALRFLSHHDLMRAFERMLRRAALPFRSTSGFHPKPRIVFPLSLPLGVIGLDEAVELELDAAMQAAEVHDRLAAQAPAGLDLLSIHPIPKNTTGQAVAAVYRLAVPPDRLAGLAERCRDLLERSECPVERIHPRPRSVDIRPYLLGLNVVDESLLMDLRVTPTGTAKAEEVLALLGLADLLDSGSVLERIRLQLHDEPAPGDPPAAAAAPLDSGAAPVLAGDPQDC